MADDLHTLSAPYALDALSAEDRDRFESHLATCERCRADLAGLTDAAASLAFAVEGPVPPAVLRSRILDAARAEGPSNVVAFRPRAVSRWITATAAVAAVAIVALGAWSVSLHHSLSDERGALRVLGDPTARHIAVTGGQVVVSRTGVAVLDVHLPSLPNGKTYEAWVASSSVKRAGQFAGGVTTLPLRVAHGARVMVTIERAGGVDAPTSQPLLVAQT